MHAVGTAKLTLAPSSSILLRRCFAATRAREHRLLLLFTHMAAEVEAESPFEALPDALTVRILGKLPSDARARCAAVRPAWRDLLKSPAAWTSLDLSSPMTCSAGAEDVLRIAAAKAGGTLAFLDVSGCDELRVETLLPVVADNADALRELRATVRRC